MKNVVLIVADTLSAFHLPPYGYDRETAPFLSELAEDGAFFQFAYANAPWTLPSHASLFSGELPSEHGTTTANPYFAADSFVEDLQEDGHATVGFSNNPPLAAAGFDQGFDHWQGSEAIALQYRGLDAFEAVVRRELQDEYDGKREKYVDFLKEVVRRRDLASLVEAARFVYREKVRSGRHSFVDDSGAEATNALAEERLEAVEEPFFLFVNYMETHEPYGPPLEHAERWVDSAGDARERYLDMAYLEEPGNIGIGIDESFREDIIGLYDASIRYLDGKIEELYEHISAAFDDTVFIIVSDHGENLGHHGMWGHQYGGWERLIRVPLIVAGDGVPDTVVDDPVSLHDLHQFIRGDADLEELGTDRVTAQYRGAFRFYMDGDEDKLEEYGEEAEKVLRNEARCLVDGAEGAVRHSHLADQGFEARPDGPGDSADPATLQLFQDVDRFGTETEGIDI